jgi:parallel beta-helix repeat protein
VIDNASNATFFGFLADNNTGNGVTINSAAAPAAPTSNVRLLTFDASSNTFKGVTITATGSLLEHFTVFSNGEDGVKVDGGSGNTLSKFSAGTAATPGSGNGGAGVRLHKGGSNTVIEGETSLNAQSGIHLEGSNNNRISRSQSFSNVGGAGVWFDGSSQNTLSDFRACGNANSGVYIGCSATTLPSNTSCGSSPHSNGNVIATGAVLSNQVGIGIDLANGTNRVMGNDAVDTIASTPCSAANTTDLEDDNTNCGTNFWTIDVFATPPPGSCIK